MVVTPQQTNESRMSKFHPHASLTSEACVLIATILFCFFLIALALYSHCTPLENSNTVGSTEIMNFVAAIITSLGFALSIILVILAANTFAIFSRIQSAEKKLSESVDQLIRTQQGIGRLVEMTSSVVTGLAQVPESSSDEAKLYRLILGAATKIIGVLSSDSKPVDEVEQIADALGELNLERGSLVNASNDSEYQYKRFLVTVGPVIASVYNSAEHFEFRQKVARLTTGS